MATVAEERPASSSSPLSVDEEVNKLMSQGKRHFLCNQIVESVKSFQEACRLLGEKYGQTANECGDAYFQYGKSLFELARHENGVLGNALTEVPIQEADSDDEAKLNAEQQGTGSADTCEGSDDKGNTAKDASEAKDEGEEKEPKKEEKMEEIVEGDKTKKEQKKEDSNVETKEADESENIDDDGLDKDDGEAGDTGDDDDVNGDTKDGENKAGETKDGETKDGKSKDGENKDAKNKDGENKDGETKDGETKDGKNKDAKNKEGENKEGENKDGENKDGENKDAKNKDAKNKEGAKNEDGENKDGENEETVDPDAVPTMQLAWEMLELARIIFKRLIDPETQLKLAQAHLLLGEINIEQDQFTDGISELMKCLNIQKPLLPHDDRLLAETYYNLGLANTLSMNYTESATYYELASNVLELRIKNIKNRTAKEEAQDKGKGKATGDDSYVKDKIELIELEELLPEVKAKCLDAKSESEKIKMDIKRQLGLTTTGFGCPESCSSSPAQPIEVKKKKADDISHLVKRTKRKPEDQSKEENTDLPAKKFRQDGENTTLNGNSSTTPGVGTEAMEIATAEEK